MARDHGIDCGEGTVIHYTGGSGKRAMRLDAMIIYQIYDRDDATYLFPREWYENPRVVYHGTSSVSSAAIEEVGLQTDASPATPASIEYVREAFERIDLSGYGASRYGTRDPERTGGARQPVSFSSDYWTARNYATKLGGEAVKELLSAAKKYHDFVRSRESIERHRARLVRELNGPHYPRLPEETRRMLQALDDEKDLLQRDVRIQEIAARLESYTGGMPIVYAVSVEPEWFVNWQERQHVAGCPNPILPVDLFCRSVPPERILGKVVFPNGAKRREFNFNEPRPLPWVDSG